MSAAEDIGLLKAEIRELRSLIQGLQAESRVGVTRQVRLARKEGAAVGAFQDVILLTGNLQDRHANPIVSAQKLNDLLVVENEGQWFWIDCNGQPPASAHDCTCALITILETNGTLTAQEASDARGNCLCGSIACEACATGEGPAEWSLAIDGATASYSSAFDGDQISNADLDAVLAVVNASRNMSNVSSCLWRHEETVVAPSGDQFIVKRTLQLGDFLAPLQGGWDMEVTLEVTNDPGNATRIQATLARWHLLDQGSQFDCTSTLSANYVDQIWTDGLLSSGFVDSSTDASVSVNPV